MREQLEKLATAAARAADIEREERVEFYLEELREKLRADSGPRATVDKLASALAEIDFSSMPLTLRARYKETLALLENLLGGNPACQADPVTPTAQALVELIDAGLLTRP